MGGSKSQTVGYRYYLGVHAIFLQMEADSINRIRFEKKDAWKDQITAPGSFQVAASDLFGGDSREGGVAGVIDFETGHSTQGRNAYLQSILGNSIPAYRGVTGLVFRGYPTIQVPGFTFDGAAGGFYFGMNPYLKAFSAQFTRIHKTTDGAVQWYDSKAALSTQPAGELPLNSTWKYKVVPNTDTADYSSSTLDDSGWATGQAPFGTQSGGFANFPADFNPTPNTMVPENKIVWMRKTITITDSLNALREAEVFVDDNLTLWINDVQISKVGDNGAGVILTAYSKVNIPTNALRLGDNKVVLKASNIGVTSKPTAPNPGYGDMRILEYGPRDMNPAHIIRECLTDPDWGLGYLAADIDDVSFTSAADTLYSENMGISLLWDQQMSIEEFVKEVLRHINGTLYVSRSTGLFVLKLIRGDYVVANLPVLGVGDIEKITNYSERAFGDLVNSVTVNFWDSTVDDTGSVTEQDPALVAMQGTVIGTTIQYPGFSNKDLAERVALRDLGTLSTPLKSCKAYAKWSAAKDLNIGDVFVLNWPDITDPFVVRVTGMSLGDGKANKIQLQLTEDAFALPVASLKGSVLEGFQSPLSAPAALVPRSVIEMPYFEVIQRYGQSTVDSTLSNSPSTGYLQAAGGKSNGGAINFILETDSGSGYQSYSNVDLCPTASLVAAVGFLDTTFDVTGALGLDEVTAGTYALLGDEFIGITSISGSTLTVKRGVLDSVPTKHSAGDPVLFLDEFSGSDGVEYVSSEVVNVKMLTVTLNGQLDAANAPVDSVTMNGRAARPYPPGNVKINNATYPTTVSGTFTVTWSHRNRKTQADTLVDTTAGDVTPAPNTRYGLRFLDASGTLLVERTDIGPGTASVTLNYTGAVTMELYAIDDVGTSLQKHSFSFSYTGTSPNAITATAYTPVSTTTVIDGGTV